ncbi:replication initiator protein A [Holzapfeliella sp. JNUCC 72]
MNQFFMFDKQLLEDKRLTNDERVCYMLLADRMKSSVKRSDFFDAKAKAHYVIYTIVELIETLGTKRNKTIKILKNLEKYGYIIKKRTYSKATKLFLPNFEDVTTKEVVSLDDKPTEVYETNSNQTNLNQIHTNDTTDTWDILEEIIENKVKPQTKETHSEELVQEPTVDVNATIQKDALEVLKASLVATGLPEPLVNTLKAYAFNNADKLYQYAGLIFKAKSVAKKNAERLIGRAEAAFKFESNSLMTTKLATDIKKIIITSHRVAKNKAAYMMRSLINLFEEQANAYLMA